MYNIKKSPSLSPLMLNKGHYPKLDLDKEGKKGHKKMCNKVEKKKLYTSSYECKL